MSTTAAREQGSVTADFEAFVLQRSTALLRVAWLLTHDHAQAEDLLQIALAKSWFAWHRMHGEPEPYVRRVLVNAFLSARRRRWRAEVPTEEIPETAAGTDHPPDADLWPAVCRLPRRQRAVVVLRFYEDLSVAETAELLSCSPGTVKSQLSRALARLRVDPALVESEDPR